ncbi:MAG: hypothetical protein LBO69_04480 [Ignavibacteria bacterium]|jgi:aspartate kinase|nr:hypothetical protein [Ignavibacteria bacterium]
MKVYKFGGAVLNKVSGFHQLKSILQQETSKVILVVSALEKTTAKLLQAAQQAEHNNEADAIAIIDSIIDYHLQICLQLFPNSKNYGHIVSLIANKKKNLLNIIKGIAITRELTPRTQDLVLSYGEVLAYNIVEVFLSEYLHSVIKCDITNILITDSNYGNAKPDINRTRANVRNTLIPLFQQYEIIVTQGFVASNNENEITTMGYESSNLTATILAGLMDAEEFVIWTDTEGIRLADPKLYDGKNNAVANRISYELAEYLADNGLKLIHPPMIRYLREFNINVKYKSAFAPDGEYSIIEANGDNIPYKFILNNDNTNCMVIMNFEIADYLHFYNAIAEHTFSLISSYTNYIDNTAKIVYLADNNAILRFTIEFFLDTIEHF